MFTQQALGDTKTCTNTICSHSRLGVIHRLVPTLYVHTTGLGWYTDVYQHYMFTQQAWGDTKTCTNTICSHNRLRVIQRLVPKRYVHTAGLGDTVLVQLFVSPQACCVNIYCWYTSVYQPKPVVWTYSVGTSLCITPSLLCEHIVLVQVFISWVIQRLVPSLYLHTTGLGWYKDLYQHYMFTQLAGDDIKTCTNTICSHNRLGDLVSPQVCCVNI
jgi:hypothetical protein